ncbi:MAG: B12-binding domain-containing radical SAM protein [Deltaproteobacteria bacterium]|nr:B12-binding domain-containing radical SAM protein [Deltaproteobacteria bacterium]
MKRSKSESRNFNDPCILLVNPWIHDFAAHNLWSQPLGLLYLAALLRQAGYRLNFLDCLDIYHPELQGEGLRRVRHGPWGTGKFPKQRIPTPPALADVPRPYHRYGITPRIFRRELISVPVPDAVLVTSGMTYWYPGVVEAVKMVRETFPSTPVILGGIYATLCPKHARQAVEPDYLVEGPGEYVVPGVVAGATGGPMPPPTDPSRPETLPFPALDLCREMTFTPILTSRGCPYRCPYCATGLLYHGFIRRSPESVVDELEYWLQLKGTRDVAFYDDALLMDFADHLGPVLEKVLSRGLLMRFHTPNGLHARYVDRESAFLMRRAGFRTIRLSLETADPSRQLQLGNKTDNDTFRRAVGFLTEAGFGLDEVGAYLMVGLPGQEMREVQQSVDFVLGLGLKPLLAEYSPLPGTPMWEEARRASRYPLEDDPLYQNNSALPCAGPGFGFAHLKSERERIRNHRSPQSSQISRRYHAIGLEKTLL